MQEKIVVPFAPILVESTRSIGYSFEAAVADVIDNSISAQARDIYVNFMTKGDAYVSITDDGYGMNEIELEAAMRYGSKSSLEVRDKNDLGRFGLGLKMASLSQCRQLTVISKKDGKLYGAMWDLDKIIERGDWVLLKLDKNEIEAIPHADLLSTRKSGTIVMWRLFDRINIGSSNPHKVLDEKIDLAADHIALVFHRFMGDENFTKRLRIFFNDRKIEPIDPFLTNHAATQPLVEQVIRIENSEIRVKPFILPYVSKLSGKDIKNVGGKEDLRQRQGFYVYRNKRLIIWGTWFRLIKQYELNKLARVRVDIPNSLDSIWEIDIKKSTASLPDLIKKNLINIVENTVGRSERVYKYRGRKVDNDSLQHIWNKVDNRGKYQYLINRELPMFKILESRLDEEGIEYLDSFIRVVEDSFPYSAVYYDLAKNESNIEAQTLEDAEVHRIGVDMVRQLTAMNGDVKKFLENMDKTDFFIKYPEAIKSIRGEFQGDS